MIPGTRQEALSRLETIRTLIQGLELERDQLHQHLNLPFETRGRAKELTGKSLHRAELIRGFLRDRTSGSTRDITQHILAHEMTPGGDPISPKSLGCFVSTLLNYLCRRGELVRIRSGFFRLPTGDGEILAPEYPPASKKILLEMRAFFHEDPQRVIPMKMIVQWLGGTVPGDTRTEAVRLIRILLRYGDIQRVTHGKYKALVPPTPTDTSG